MPVTVGIPDQAFAQNLRLEPADNRIPHHEGWLANTPHTSAEAARTTGVKGPIQSVREPGTFDSGWKTATLRGHMTQHNWYYA